MLSHKSIRAPHTGTVRTYSLLTRIKETLLKKARKIYNYGKIKNSTQTK